MIKRIINNTKIYIIIIRLRKIFKTLKNYYLIKTSTTYQIKKILSKHTLFYYQNKRYYIYYIKINFYRIIYYISIFLFIENFI